MASDITNIEDIKTLVDCFYENAGRDELLGSIFHHLRSSGQHKEALYHYWQTTLLEPRNPHPVPFPRHIESMFTAQHFIRWLNLFLSTIDEQFEGPNAEKVKIVVIRKSEEFQASLEMYRF